MFREDLQDRDRIGFERVEPLFEFWFHGVEPRVYGLEPLVGVGAQGIDVIMQVIERGRGQCCKRGCLALMSADDLFHR